MELAFQRVRGEVFARSALWEDLLLRRGYEMTSLDAVEEAHRQKAWQALRSRLEPSQVREAREREEPWALRYGDFVDLLRRIGRLERLPRRVDDVEDAIDYLWRLVQRLGRLPPLRNNPARSRPRPLPWWKQDGLFAGYEEDGFRLPDDLLGELMGILGDLVADFLKQLEEVGRFELPPVLPAPVRVEFRRVGARDPSVGPPGELPAGFEVQEVGETAIVSVNVGAGATVTAVGPTMRGPSVIEHIGLWSDSGFAGSVQVNLQGLGASPGAGAGAATVFGEPLFLTASNVGVAGSVLDWGAFPGEAEFWPRRMVKLTAFRPILTVTNSGGAPQRLAAALDGRIVRRSS